MTGVMTSFTTRLHRTRGLPTTDRGADTTGGGADARLFLTTYAAGFVFLFVLLG